MPGTSSNAPSRVERSLSAGWRYAVALSISGLSWAVIVASFADQDYDGPLAGWLLVADPALGLWSFLLMRYRHRAPARIALLTTAFSFVSTTSVGPASWMVGSLAARSRWRLLSVVAPLSAAGGAFLEWFYPGGDDLPTWAAALFGALVLAVIIAVGFAMGSDRERQESRAEAADREQESRVAQAQAGERTRIAREMHDVLAHRISLVAMHAGALSYRTDLTPEEQSTAARTIEENAHRALADLRGVLGVLRDPLTPGGAPEAPQPVIGDLTRLVDEERAGGMRVSLSSAQEGDVPESVARTAYRVVQEALTNARKHSPGASVTVGIAGSAGEGLTVRVHNAAKVGAATARLPRSGLGLIGLDERVALSGGRIHHGTEPGGGYVVEAWLPWST